MRVSGNQRWFRAQLCWCHLVVPGVRRGIQPTTTTAGACQAQCHDVSFSAHLKKSQTWRKWWVQFVPLVPAGAFTICIELYASRQDRIPLFQEHQCKAKAGNRHWGHLLMHSIGDEWNKQHFQCSLLSKGWCTSGVGWAQPLPGSDSCFPGCESGLPLASGCVTAGCTLRYCKAYFYWEGEGIWVKSSDKNWLGSSSLLFPAARHLKAPQDVNYTSGGDPRRYRRFVGTNCSCFFISLWPLPNEVPCAASGQETSKPFPEVQCGGGTSAYFMQ